jgi:multiple sugar transport system substrate-binding protein
MSYVKLDDYNNTLSMALNGNDKPNIFFSYTWMTANDKYDPVFASAEDLSDTSLSLDLDCIRSGLVNHDAEGHVLMVPIFSRTYGMLVNTDLFEKEGLEIPDTWTELLDICEELRD